MYAVGSEYAHAEARKSPVVDGKVLRNQRGKEQRYPLILTGIEKEIARKVVLAFGQTICGFDLLRSGGRSYVCDVNGWSFVKDSPKFWVDSANLLRQYCLEAIDPAHLERFPLGTTPLDHKPLPGSRTRLARCAARAKAWSTRAARPASPRLFHSSHIFKPSGLRPHWIVLSPWSSSAYSLSGWKR